MFSLVVKWCIWFESSSDMYFVVCSFSILLHWYIKRLIAVDVIWSFEMTTTKTILQVIVCAMHMLMICGHAQWSALSVLVKSLCLSVRASNSGTTGHAKRIRPDLDSAGLGDGYWPCFRPPATRKKEKNV